MAPARKLYTLTEVSKITGISMPTLQRYKKIYQDRIPSEGEGRKQRYPRKSFAVFKKLREENLKKRGRPAGKRKATAKSARKRPAARTAKAKTRTGSGPGRRKRAGGSGKLLTLLEIGRRTGISYPTLLRYVKVYGDEIPHVGEGRRRRFPVAAVKEFRRLRRASKRGPRAGAKKAAPRARQAAGTDQALKARVRELEKAQRQVTRQLDEIVRLLKQPMRITVRSD